jgi:hypothetical protein
MERGSSGQAVSKSPLRARAVNASHAAGVKASLGPRGSFESRTATIPGRLLATSYIPGVIEAPMVCAGCGLGGHCATE